MGWKFSTAESQNSPVIGRRAYINPLPGYPEAAQRAAILAKFEKIDEWYIESNRTTRTDFIKHLRSGDEAVVAKMACLAMARGKIDARLADLADARGDIHAKGCLIVDTEGLRSDKGWPTAKIAARQFMLHERNIKNGSAKKYNLTDAQIKTIIRVCESKRYTNDRQRLTVLKKEGIKIGRTYMLERIPQIARERGLTD